jgi:AcrR family transcriptional regulator
MSVAVISTLPAVARWDPGAKQRLQVAALELYVRQGFEQTTAGEIAQSAGLTERTFFRHFADKREVLFDGQDRLEQAFLDGVNAAPLSASPLEAVAAALAFTAEFFADERRAWSRQRHAVIAANPALRERELLKTASLAAVIAGALRARGVPRRAAVLAAETGMTVFSMAFAEWIAEDEQRSLAEVEREILEELQAMAVRAPRS